MFDTVISAKVSLGTRGSIFYSSRGYSYCSNGSYYRSAYSSSRICCSCCDKLVSRVSSCFCNFYVPRRRKSVLRGLNPCNCGLLPDFEADRSCFCDKSMEVSAGGRRRRRRRRMIFEPKLERYGYGGGIDETEIVIGLLTEDIGIESYPLSEKGRNSDICKKQQSKRNTVDLDVEDDAKEKIQQEEKMIRAEHKQPMRKDGSCSFSLSSIDGHESDNEIELKENRYMGKSSSFSRNSKDNDIVYQEGKNENLRHEDFARKSHGFAQETCSGSRVESKFEKKTEKKLSDGYMEEIDCHNNLQKQSKVSFVQELDYGNVSDKKAQLTRNDVFNKERKQQERSTGEEFFRQGKQLSAEERDKSNDDDSNGMPKDDVPIVEEPSEENTSRTGDIVVKRTERTFWNVIADFFRLRWSSRSGGKNTGGGIGGSSVQSMSNESWFSGHETDENKEFSREQERRSVAKEHKSNIQQEQKIHSKVEVDLGSIIISLPSTETEPSGNQGAASSASVVVEASSSIVCEISETGESSASGSGLSAQLNTGSVEQWDTVNIGGKKLARIDQFLKDRFDVLEEAYRLEWEQRKIDEMFMREALVEAQKAAASWEVPVGAVLIHNGQIIARGYNQVEQLLDSTAHAEMICIREASKTLGTWRLSGTTLYVTLEPCPMCAGAILQARVDNVVWGAPNKLLGADGSWIRLFPNGDTGGSGLDQTDIPTVPIHPFHPKITIRRGVLASECSDTMQQFFKLRRKKKDVKIEPPSPPSCLPIIHHPSKFFAKLHDAFHLVFCL